VKIRIVIGKIVWIIEMAFLSESQILIDVSDFTDYLFEPELAELKNFQNSGNSIIQKF